MIDAIKRWWSLKLMQYRCDHQWFPADAMIRWMCLRCGKDRDGWP